MAIPIHLMTNLNITAGNPYWNEPILLFSLEMMTSVASLTKLATKKLEATYAV